MDILSLDATDQLQALAALRISARELLEASVARMDDVDRAGRDRTRLRNGISRWGVQHCRRGLVFDSCPGHCRGFIG